MVSTCGTPVYHRHTIVCRVRLYYNNACLYECPFYERGPFALCGLDWLTFLPGFGGATAQERLRMATKLLLVEDSFSIQTIVETIFVQDDFEVMVSGDALDGLHKAQTWLPDIVLADASMPGMDGFQLCQRLRQSASDHQVPVVLLTSGFTAYDKAKGDRAGVTTHLAKPFDPQALLALVKQLVPVVRHPVSPSAAAASV